MGWGVNGVCVCVGGGITGGAVGVIKSLGYFLVVLLLQRKLNSVPAAFAPWRPRTIGVISCSSLGPAAAGGLGEFRLDLPGRVGSGRFLHWKSRRNMKHEAETERFPQTPQLLVKNRHHFLFSGNRLLSFRK